MKKLAMISLMLLAALSMAACGGEDETITDSQEQETPGESEEEGSGDPITPSPGENGRYLVVYASRSGNTERVAKLIQSTLNCDILEVEPATAYSENYSDMLERAQQELAAINQGNFPEIKGTVESFENYDLVFVGYPIWYSRMATPMQAFLHAHASKLEGKRLALFATSGSSGMSTSVTEAGTLCPKATIVEPHLLLTSSGLSQMETSVSEWLDKIINQEQETETNTSMKANITVGNRVITATLEDNAAGRDFLSRLPLEVTLNDFGNITEKIFYPDPALNTEGMTRGCAPTAGDITIYVPWKNVAFFCKNSSYNDDLIKIGRIDGDGIEALQMAGDIQVKIERQSSDSAQ